MGRGGTKPCRSVSAKSEADRLRKPPQGKKSSLKKGAYADAHEPILQPRTAVCTPSVALIFSEKKPLFCIICNLLLKNRRVSANRGGGDRKTRLPPHFYRQQFPQGR